MILKTPGLWKGYSREIDARFARLALARGELHCVGATTLNEYRKHVEKDAALARRFQPVFVGEPTVEEYDLDPARAQGEIRVHHGVRISDSALVAAATLSHRYISDRFLPDKAIDLMDERAPACACKSNSKPEELDESTAVSVQLRIEQEALPRKPTRPPRTARTAERGTRGPRGKSAVFTQRWRAKG